ncbi:phosphatidate cytidylyltransferase [Actinobacteria bacterium YIM 96077]|uniref:Phosphatidate cytidylyltransferase n=1 Tax=Phytoactinopolyspora halophila TaxID=1981511 RepID=A0A329QXS3_9ACTN|nr:phosphatidate cytidylyltransferase [Phytoactinopolyspora halophila]AYY15357.1 phosphatidate cytidylyltransferase [Actinobacteria bacterium YIM 96077]RAW16529.1 phosphatidate cytidylyltransferase [Phytoactinopolyspora halophila]
MADQPADSDDNSEPSRRPPGRAKRRPGRDLRAATAVGFLLAGLAVGTLFLYAPAFVGLVVVVMVVAVWELAHAFASREVHVPVVPAVLGTVLMLVGGFVAGDSALVVGLALTVLAIVVWRLGSPMAGYLRDVASGIFTVVYVPFLAGFAVLMVRADDGHWQVFALLAVVVASDVGGYFTGVLIGRHPMAPSASPKKTWEGFAGSLLLGVPAGMAIAVLAFEAPWWSGVLLGAVGVLGATLGDLGESMIKRDLNIKDMSSLLPGHGGIMDRLDSLLPTAPLVWLVLAFVVTAN